MSLHFAWGSQMPKYNTIDASSAKLNMTSWTIAVVAVCLLPLILMGLGVDLSSGNPPLTPKAAGQYSPGELKEAAFEALTGTFTHTILEWTAVCSALFVMILSFVYFRVTREPSLPVIGVALACAGAMDAFHTLAADRLIEAVADNKDLIPFTWAI